jgi:uncharacterized OB-fold protein
MSSDRFEANCERCGRVFEYGLFSRSSQYCPDCQEELDAESLRAIGEGKVTWVEDRLSGIPSGKSEMERQAGYTAEDHRWNISRRDKS